MNASQRIHMQTYEYRLRQISPCSPDTSRCPQKPTSASHTSPFAKLQRGMAVINEFSNPCKLSPFLERQGWLCHHNARFIVARTLIIHLSNRPIKTAMDIHMAGRTAFKSDWVEGCISTTSALHSRTNALSEVCSFANSMYWIGSPRHSKKFNSIEEILMCLTAVDSCCLTLSVNW